jgi:hypothetical protein
MIDSLYPDYSIKKEIATNWLSQKVFNFVYLTACIQTWDIPVRRLVYHNS